MKQIKLTNDITTRRIETTSERRIVRLIKLMLKENGEFVSVSPDKINLQYLTYGDVEQKGSIAICYIDDSNKEYVFRDGSINVNWDNVSSIEFILDINNQKPAEYELFIFYEDIDRIENEKGTTDFYEHLTLPKNHNILFSAPFGEGKSTFLKYFFQENENKFEVFKVFPVNYSVASNEDIFKYIKADILLQLMGKGVEFDETEFSHIETTQQFILNNPKNIVINLFKTGLSLSQSTNHLVNAIEGFEKFCKEYHKEFNTDDQAKAISFVEKLYNEEGSLFEDNFYTQLIRQLVDRVKEEPERKSVLVIDDLDRMDPDHIFRILNVISAQCDSYNLGDEQFSNKFGFDHIILVCDIDNIRNIFEHRYGEKVKFGGYINKFYSSEIFRFEGSVLVDFIVNTIEQKNYNENFKDSLLILKILCEIELLTPRDLIKSFNTIDLDLISRTKVADYISRSKHKIFDINFWPLLYSLKEFFGKEHFILKLNSFIDSRTLSKNLSLLCGQLMLGLLPANPDASSAHYVKLNSRKFRLVIGSNMRDLYIKELELTNVGAPNTRYSFKESDFYELLIENIKLL